MVIDLELTERDIRAVARNRLSTKRIFLYLVLSCFSLIALGLVIYVADWLCWSTLWFSVLIDVLTVGSLFSFLGVFVHMCRWVRQEEKSLVKEWRNEP